MRCLRFFAFLCLVQFQVAAAGDRTVLESTESQVGLLELFTSEGCSSCPPADRWMSDLKDDARVWKQFVPVVFHVDYWDYLGWRDRFASAQYSNRQRLHAAKGGVRTVYTPGFVLNGKEWRSWFRRPDLDAGAARDAGRLRVAVDGGKARVQFAPAHPLRGDLEVNCAILGFDLHTQVRAGENHGRRLEHDFVVIGYESAPLGKDGYGYVAEFALPAARVDASKLGLAAWVSKAGDPRPIQAVGGWLKE